MKALDALVGREEFDIIAEFGVEIPLRTIGFLFGIPEADQDVYRKVTDDAISTDGAPVSFDQSSFDAVLSVLGGLRRVAIAEPVDDLMTELLNAEVDEPDGSRRRADPRRGRDLRHAWSPAPGTRRRPASSGSRCSCSPSTRTNGASSSRTPP